MRPIRGDPSTTGPTQSPTTHRARTRPNEDLTREREAVTRYHRKNACIKFGVDTSTTGTIQGRTTHRARTRPNKKQTREREVVIANHVRMSREQPVQSSVSVRALRARPKAQRHVDPKRLERGKKTLLSRGPYCWSANRRRAHASLLARILT
ncbi:hypothetical protein HanXRQr2_Chr14g0664621 [Helianthus annuus]|uniref:Uncharacterized protein n=1 Tax=Helianthus annuus TaxID=4232 RepID=A0A9K3H8D8_HELAN|nr:hypothetical protein HanXRQr2_Chr14g0664621 [Helianthus annuus]KAJ0465763.1 hypothetical protein HanHA300_Chr14g0541731 [Helianthus annuus]KAJ0842101.1 hypothetical protein HanPSC8_Chr14g0637851 [Helianthus annuus]